MMDTFSLDHPGTIRHVRSTYLGKFAATAECLLLSSAPTTHLLQASFHPARTAHGPVPATQHATRPAATRQFRILGKASTPPSFSCATPRRPALSTSLPPSLFGCRLDAPLSLMCRPKRRSDIAFPRYGLLPTLSDPRFYYGLVPYGFDATLV
jgi:hypothetical protein